MKRLVLSLVTLAFTASAGAASDLPAKAPAVPAPVVDWTGVYFGAHAGFGGGMTDWLGVSDFAGSGGLLGGQVGINKQLGSFVFGLEVDGSWAGIKGTQSTSFGGPAIGAGYENRTSSRIDGIATFAGRAGLAADRWLVFAKGGLATVHEQHNRFFTDQFSPGNFTIDESAKETRVGAMLGFGAEYALTPNWSLKGEYDYLHMAGRDVRLNGTATYAGIPRPFTTTFSVEQAIHLVKFGANYRFGAIAPDPHFAAVAPAPGTNWSGPYIGVQGGYGWERENLSYFNPTLPGSGALGADNWLAGFNGGINAQAGSLVFGVEGEWMWTGLKPGQTFAGPMTPGPGTATVALVSTIDWLAVASAKAGFVVGDKLLVYGRGGVAIAQEKHKAAFGFVIPAGSSAYDLSGEAIHTGGVIGAGLEYALGNNWSVKAEYDYIRMLGQNYTGTGGRTANFGVYNGTISDFANFDKMSQELQFLKFGVNYHFMGQ